MKKKQGLNARERVVVREVSKGRTVTEAGRKAWPKQKPESAAVSASRALRKARVQTELQKAYVKVGINDEFLALKAKELCEATSPSFSQGIEVGTVPNWPARGKGLEIIHKVRGDNLERLEVGEPGEFSGLSERLERARQRSLEAMRARSRKV